GVPEAVDGDVEDQAEEGPEAADGEVAQDDAEEEGEPRPVAAQAAVAQDGGLDRPRNEEAQPDPHHGPTPGDGEAQRVERPAVEVHLEQDQSRANQEANPHGADRRY